MRAKRAIASVIGLATGAIAVAAAETPALAAAPAICALYAREFSVATVTRTDGAQADAEAKRIEDRVFYRCLNMDEDPKFPTTSAYASADPAMLTDQGGDVAEGDASQGDETPVTTAPPATIMQPDAASAEPAPAAPANVATTEQPVAAEPVVAPTVAPAKPHVKRHVPRPATADTQPTEPENVIRLRFWRGLM